MLSKVFSLLSIKQKLLSTPKQQIKLNQWVKREPELISLNPLNTIHQLSSKIDFNSLKQCLQMCGICQKYSTTPGMYTHVQICTFYPDIFVVKIRSFSKDEVFVCTCTHRIPKCLSSSQ